MAARTATKGSIVPLLIRAACPFLGAIERKAMKPRLLIRALCVGAALLVPAGGLAVMGVGTASATTVDITGQIKLGTLGSMLLTKSCVSIATQCTLGGTSYKIKKTGASTNLHVTLSTAKLLITGGDTAPTAMSVKAGWKGTIAATGGLPGNGCVISGGPKITFTISGHKGTVATVSLSGTSVSGCPSATITLITTDLHTSKLSGTITV
jgi:hypothetical protein